MELGLGNASILMKLWCFGPGQEQFIHLSIWWNPNTHWAEALKLRWKSYRFGLKLKITTVLGVKNGGPNTWDRLGPPSLWCFPGSFQLPNPNLRLVKPFFATPNFHQLPSALIGWKLGNFGSKPDFWSGHEGICTKTLAFLGRSKLKDQKNSLASSCIVFCDVFLVLSCLFCRGLCAKNMLVPNQPPFVLAKCQGLSFMIVKELLRLFFSDVDLMTISEERSFFNRRPTSKCFQKKWKAKRLIWQKWISVSRSRGFETILSGERVFFSEIESPTQSHEWFGSCFFFWGIYWSDWVVLGNFGLGGVSAAMVKTGNYGHVWWYFTYIWYIISYIL